MNTYVSKFLPAEVEKFKAIFESENAKFSAPQYMFFQARGNGFTASFYTSGKLVIQGNKTGEIVSKYFDAETGNKTTSSSKIPANIRPKTAAEGQISLLNLQECDFSECEASSSQILPAKCAPSGQIAPYPHIGIDESGKGDFFGPLVVAGVLIDENSAKTLQNAGVLDSKKLNDKKILELENLIKQVSTFDIIAISPLKYNELYSKFKNLNRLLAWGHSTVLENILTKKSCDTAISDKFADEKVILSALKERGKNIRLIQQTKAESDTAVAAASVLARAEFVKRVSNLSAQYEINLPKGASSLVLEAGRKFVQKYGKDEVKNVGKLHFKTYLDISTC